MSEATTAFEEDLLEERIRTTLWDPALFGRMLRFALPYWRRVVAGTALVGASTVLWLAPPTLIGALVDLAFPRGDLGPQVGIVAKILAAVSGQDVQAIQSLSPESLLWVFGGLFLIVRVSQFLVDWANGYLLMGLGQRVVYDLRLQVFRHLHDLSLAYFHRNPVGRLVTRTTNDVQALEDMFGVALVTIVKDVAMLVGIVAALLAYHTPLALTVLAVLPFMVVATIIFRREARAAYRLWRAAISRLNAFIAESLSGVRVVKLFRKEVRNDEAYDGIGREWMRHFVRQRRAWAVFRPVNTTLSSVGIGLVLWFGGGAALRTLGMDDAAAEAAGLISVGLLITFVGYAEQFFAPIRDLTEKFDIIQSAMTAGERIFTILDERNEIEERPDAVRPDRLEGKVEFRDVNFEYVAGEPVIRELSFRIEPGEMVAIVGHTGAGKTTIVNLVSRFWDVQEGAVLVDDRDVREYALRGLRGNVAMVHQDVFLFAGSIAENLRLGDDAIPFERVRAACEAVQANRFIERLPGGYDGKVEEGGKTFSAGERQLLSFARALVFDPAILVLDEATSSVDTHTEELIQAAMTRVTEGRTSVVIAHRLSTIQRADRILLLDRGRLLEQGTHAELLRQGGVYERLYRLQFAEEDIE
jgi:ABC-type multidrug transport system fused ATPase/permease subunit